MVADALDNNPGGQALLADASPLLLRSAKDDTADQRTRAATAALCNDTLLVTLRAKSEANETTLILRNADNVQALIPDIILESLAGVQEALHVCSPLRREETHDEIPC